MRINKARPAIAPGEMAPDFVLTAVDGMGSASPADYRAKDKGTLS